MSRMSTGTSSLAAVRCTTSAPTTAEHGEREAGQGYGDAERRAVQASTRLGAGRGHHHDHRAPNPIGRTRRSSVSRLARACRSAASESTYDPAAGGAADGRI